MKFTKEVLLVVCMIIAALFACACNKEDEKAVTLFVPENLAVSEDGILSWDKVDGADGYEVSIDGKIYETASNSLDICLLTVDPDLHAVKVRAKVNGETARFSHYSETIYYTSPAGVGYGVKLTSDESGYVVKAMGDVGRKLVIPDEFNGKPVVEIISNAFSDVKTLKAVYIPDSVKEIKNFAFANCSSLEYVRLPVELKTLGGSVFKDCVSLKTVVMPIYLEVLSSGAFLNCTSLEQIDLPESITKFGIYTFQGCTSYRDLFIGKNVVTLSPVISCNHFEHITVDEENEVFYSKDDCVYQKADGALVLTCKNGIVSEDVKIIADNAFYGRKDLTEFSMPDTVEEVGESCFKDCTALKRVTFSSSLKSLGIKCFEHCYDLESIEIPAQNDKYYAEGNCLIERETKTVVFGCKNVVIPATVETIGEYAFYKVGIEEISIPSNVKTICDFAFLQNYDLKYVALRDGLEYIGEDAFAHCYSIEYISIPRTVTHIGGWAFMSVHCSVALPKEIEKEYIGENAFSNCTIYTENSQDEYRLNETRYQNGSLYGNPFAIICGCEFIEEDGVFYINSITIDAFLGVPGNIYLGQIIYIQIPERYGYVFKGWAYEENGENQFTFDKRRIYSAGADMHLLISIYDWAYNRVNDGEELYLEENIFCITPEEADYLNENKRGVKLYALWDKE